MSISRNSKGFEFNNAAVEVVKGFLANPLSLYDPLFIGISIRELAATCSLYPNPNILLKIQDLLPRLTPVDINYRALSEELESGYHLRSMIFRATFKELGVEFAGVNDLRFIGKHKELFSSSQIFFPLSWVTESNKTTYPLFSINSWSYLPVEYNDTSGKAYINKSDADYGDALKVLASRFYHTNENIRVEVERLHRSSNVGFKGLSQEEFFTSSVKEVFYGSRGNRKISMVNTIGVDFVLWLYSRESSFVNN